MSKNQTPLPEKINQLANEHGEWVRDLIAKEKIPKRHIGNFYGRHFDRREVILAEMKSGTSYNKAYDLSDGVFDTRKWEKIFNRAAACRGLLLKTAVLLVTQPRSDFTPDEKKELTQLAQELGTTAKELVGCILRYELTSMVEEPHKTSSKKTKPIEMTFKEVRERLRTALSKLRKNVRDAPLMSAKLGDLPSVRFAAQVALECGRMVSGVPVFLAALESASSIDRRTCTEMDATDPWGIGIEYSRWLAETVEVLPPGRRIATHCEPDADALTSAWMAERFLFPRESCEIEFLPRDFKIPEANPYDCIVDLGRVHDPQRRIFDHKPPAFAHRDKECATSLVWKQARRLRRPVKHLSRLVEVVHDGDAATRRQKSSLYVKSRQNGLHALIAHARQLAQNDQMLYQGISLCLDALATMEGEGSSERK